jgi:hypothetical protein
VLQPSTSYEQDGHRVTLYFAGLDSQTDDSLPEPERAFRIIFTAVFEIEGQDAVLEAEDRRAELVAFLIPIVNRAFRAVRNFGIAAHISEVRSPTSPSEVVSLLREWCAEFAGDDGRWAPLVEPLDGLARILARTGSPTLYPFRVSAWPDVDEAIQDNLAPGPEQEFLVNSIEYLRAKNYRTALIEATVCLEIVTSQFLTTYLSTERALSQNRIDKVLTKDVGLTSRIGLLIELVLTSAETGNLIESVLRAITWRNSIIHKTGHLPQNLRHEDIEAGIRSVLGLATLLALKRDQIASTPEARALGAQFADIWHISAPKVVNSRRHHWLVEVQFSLGEDFPRSERLAAMVEDVIRLLSARDARFVPEEHLFVRFSQLGSTIYAWSSGHLEQLATAVPALRFPLAPQPVE